MSNSIDNNPRAAFFPNSKPAASSVSAASIMKRNDYARTKELNSMSADDAKVQINDAIKDFSRIKKAVDSAPEIDNSNKVAELKAQIQAGTYKIDYDALADKILGSEF